jgi:hypothetical protein
MAQRKPESPSRQPENIKMTESMQRLAVTMSEHIAMALSNPGCTKPEEPVDPRSLTLFNRDLWKNRLN